MSGITVSWKDGQFRCGTVEIDEEGDPSKIRAIVDRYFSSDFLIGPGKGTRDTGFHWCVVPLNPLTSVSADPIEIKNEQLFCRVKPHELREIVSGIIRISDRETHHEIIESIRQGEYPYETLPSEVALHAVKGYYEGRLTKDEMVTTMLYTYVVRTYAPKERCIEPLASDNTLVYNYFSAALKPYFTKAQIDLLLSRLDEVSPIERKFVLCMERIRQLPDIVADGTMLDLEFRKHFMQFTFCMVEADGSDFLLLLPPGIFRLLSEIGFDTNSIELDFTFGYSKKWEDCSGSSRVIGVPSAITSLPKLIHGREGKGTAFYLHDLGHATYDSANPFREELSTLETLFIKLKERSGRLIFRDRDFPLFFRKNLHEMLFSRSMTNQELFWITIASSWEAMEKYGTTMKQEEYFKKIIQCLSKEHPKMDAGAIRGLSAAVRKGTEQNKKLVESVEVLERVSEKLTQRKNLLELYTLLKTNGSNYIDHERIGAIFSTLSIEIQYAIYGALYKSLEHHRSHPEAGKLAFWEEGGHRCTPFQRRRAVLDVAEALAV